ncbi:MAG: hypothetical protein H6719_13480 [Sandaracinaceae bacterium]|nr:hypothetical protein [Sandaracinaceae bacterium]
MRSTAPLILGVLLLACEPHLAVGSPCVRSGECDEPLACLLGRCRAECVNPRDCSPGLRCVEATPGIGACTLPPEEDCTDSCDGPLVCRDHQCRNTCDDMNPCLASSRCEDGTCVTPPTEPLDGGTADGGAVDAGSRDAGPIRPCSSDPQCATGEVCAIEFGVSWCTPECTTHEECAAIDPDSTCDRYQNPDEYFGCTLVCAPGTPEGCPPGSMCSVAPNGSGTGGPNALTLCRSSGPSSNGEGCPCFEVGGSECDAGLSCPQSGARAMTCARSCVVGSDDCGAGLTCEREPGLAVVVHGEEYGFCQTSGPPSGCSAP